MVFDKNNRWHDERGRFAPIPSGVPRTRFPPEPAPRPPRARRLKADKMGPIPRYEVTWVFSVRGFGEPRKSPPREDTAKWIFEGSEPTSGELFLAWQEIEAGYRDQEIYAFNESIPDVKLLS